MASLWGGFGLATATIIGITVSAGTIYDTEIGVGASFGSSLDAAVGAGVHVDVGKYLSLLSWCYWRDFSVRRLYLVLTYDCDIVHRLVGNIQHSSLGTSYLGMAGVYFYLGAGSAVCFRSIL